MTKIEKRTKKIANSLKQDDPDFYFEHVYQNKKRNQDVVKSPYSFKSHEVDNLREQEEFWQNAKLKAWSNQFQANKKKTYDLDEYLI